MRPDQFIEKWGISKVTLSKLLGLSYAQVERWFFDVTAKNRTEPKQSHLDRLGEIDYLQSIRSGVKVSDSRVFDRLKKLIPN